MIKVALAGHILLELRRGTSALVGLITLLGAAPTAAAEPEAVHLEIDDALGCTDDFRADVEALGGVFRDAERASRARTFRIELEAATPAKTTTKTTTGRLIVRDLVFREHVREITKPSCEEVARLLALFMATALDEAATPVPASRPNAVVASPSPSLSPSPPPRDRLPATTLETEDVVPPVAPRMGSGGMVLTGYASGLSSSTSAEGVRLHAAIRAGDDRYARTRLGIALAAAQQTRDTMVGFGDERDVREKSSGSSKRAGVFVGWGAPWNDRVVGFGAEFGVMGESHRGTAHKILPTQRGCETFFTTPSACAGPARPTSWSAISPYLSSQIVFQIPIKGSPVRPVASLGALWAITGGPQEKGYSAMTADLGVVWQAW